MDALAVDLLAEDEEMEAIALRMAELAIAIVMDMEEGVVLVNNSWEAVRVDMDDYRQMGDPSFALHFRMPKRIFEALENEIGNHLINTGRWRRERTPLRDILLMVIWILATPDSFRSVALRFGVVPGTLYFHYSYIIEALRELAPQYIKWPGENERDDIKLAFERASGFPGIVGSIDCSHVYVTKPIEHAHAQRYMNRHHSFSLTTQAVVDNNLLVRDLHVGEAGSLHDSRTFRRSPLYRSLIEDNNNNMLRPDEHLVGDGAYITTNFLLTPFPDNGHRTEEQLHFNRRLSQSRVRVENAFGLWTSKREVEENKISSCHESENCSRSYHSFLCST